MGDAARKLPTFEELYARIRDLPEGITGEILEPGVLRTMSRPGRAHRKAARNLARHLDGYDHNVGGSGWWIEVEAEIRFSPELLAVPDVSGFRMERVPVLPPENPLTICPDWCCEILSPTTARVDRSKKLPLYASSGVPWIWLVDPDQRMVEVYETIQRRPVLAAIATTDQRVVLPPFNGEFDLGPWWLPETPEPEPT